MKLPFLSKGPTLLAALILGWTTPLIGHAVVRPSASISQTPEAPGTGQLQPGVDYIPGEVLVTFKPAVSTSARTNIARSMGDRMGQGLEGLPEVARVELRSGSSVQSAIQGYEADPRVRHAQPNFIYHAQATTPDDPEFENGNLWGLENTSTPSNDIDAPEAWDYQIDCTSTRVAVLDTGINHEHADLAGNMWTGATNHGRDFVGTNDGDPIPNGGATHGTHVAGTIAAIGNNSKSTTGVCWQAEILAVRVLGPAGSGTTADIVEGVDYAVNNGAKVINMSLGGGSYDQNFKDALTNARDNGVLVMAAAGNGGSDGVGDDNDTTPVYPCNYAVDNIVCVAALNQSYDLASFSNYGDQTVDVGAPGVNILSTYPGATVSAAFGNWTKDPEWAVDTSCHSNYDFLVNPSDWCTGGPYGNGLDSRSYQAFDLTDSSLGAGYHYYLDLALNTGDSFEVGHYAGTGDPFANSPTLTHQVSGSSDSNGFAYHSAVPGGCLGNQCSIGFRLLSDGTDNANGAAVAAFELQKITASATQTDYLQGTSMATPHVAGIAALGWAYKTTSDYSQVRDAIRQGGDSLSALSTTTTTGREADAFGTLAELSQPPTVANASLTTTSGSTKSKSLAASDPEGDPLSWSVTSYPNHGAAAVDSSGTVTYTASSGYAGSDSFTVEANDGLGNTDTATVSVTVNDSGGGGGGGGGCTLAAKPGSPDPVWLLMVAVPWLLRRYVVTGRD